MHLLQNELPLIIISKNTKLWILEGTYRICYPFFIKLLCDNFPLSSTNVHPHRFFSTPDYTMHIPSSGYELIIPLSRILFTLSSIAQTSTPPSRSGSNVFPFHRGLWRKLCVKSPFFTPLQRVLKILFPPALTLLTEIIYL